MLLSLDMSKAAHIAAARVNSQLDARSAGRGGELVKFANGILGFSCSAEVEEAAILENALTFSTLRANLYECTAALFVFAFKPVLLRGLKRLTIESVREQRYAWKHSIPFRFQSSAL
jgi:hypothetical protein